jgi:predicted metal-dependent hydrolase
MEKMIEIETEQGTYRVHITYKKIRSVYLRVGENGVLNVSAPYGVSDQMIAEFILSRLDWVKKTQMKEEKRENSCATGRDGREASWLGQRLPVRFEVSSKKEMIVEENDILFHMPSFNPDLAEALFYQTAARHMVPMVKAKRKQWDDLICRANGIVPPRITIKYMTSRWGSCTPSRHHISLSVRLMHFPEGSMDYVILHEYAHFLEGNHSRNFYAIIEHYMPDWKKYNAFLK